jgi:hypothetical protein
MIAYHSTLRLSSFLTFDKMIVLVFSIRHFWFVIIVSKEHYFFVLFSLFSEKYTSVLNDKSYHLDILIFRFTREVENWDDIMQFNFRFCIIQMLHFHPL